MLRIRIKTNFAEPNQYLILFFSDMLNFKKWVYKYDENGFVNKKNEQLEKYLMIGFVVVICIVFLSLVALVIIET